MRIRAFRLILSTRGLCGILTYLKFNLFQPLPILFNSLQNEQALKNIGLVIDLFEPSSAYLLILEIRSTVLLTTTNFSLSNKQIEAS